MTRILILLEVFAFSISYAQQKTDSAFLIREAVQEVNEKIYSQRQMRLELLKDCPEMIPVLAEWEYQDWHRYDMTLTREKLVNAFNYCLNDDRLPLAFVIFKDSIPIGVISLDAQAEPEMADLEDGNPWGGSFHVIPSERNRGLGEEMAKTLVGIAKRLGHDKIHFFTSNRQVVKWYADRGAKIVDTRPFRGHTITTFEYELRSRE